jgi:Tfp pilus assembly protein PilO
MLKMGKLTTGGGSSNSDLIMLGIFLLIIGIGGSYKFLIPSLVSTKGENQKLIATNNGLLQDISNLKAAKSSLNLAQKNLTAMGVDLSLVNQVVPPNEEMPWLYLQMEYLINNSPNLSTPIYKIGVPLIDKTGGEGQVSVSVSATGKYEDLKQFLMKLENNIRPIVITSVNFSQPQSDSTSGSATSLAGKYSLTATGYVISQGLSAAYTSTTNTPAK